jgi:hypothetical protein
MAELYRIRYQSHGSHADLENSITIHRRVYNHQIACGLSDPSTLNHLGAVISERAQISMHEHDIQEAVTLHEEALRAVPGQRYLRALSISGLVQARRVQRHYYDDESQLRRDVSLVRQALSLVPETCSLHASLDIALLELLSMLPAHGQAWLEELISLPRRAVSTLPTHHRNRPWCLARLGNELFLQALRTNAAWELVERDRQLLREALSRMSPMYPRRPIVLSFMSSVIVNSCPFRRTSLSDIDEAVQAGRQAIMLIAPSHYHYSLSLDSLATSLSYRFLLRPTPQRSDIDEAIVLYSQILKVHTPINGPHIVLLQNLSSALFYRFRTYQEVEDILQARILQKEALRQRSIDDPERAYALWELANSLMANPAASPPELEEIIALITSSLPQLANRTDHRLVALETIAQLHYSVFLQTRYHENWKRSMDIFRAGVSEKLATPVLRLRAAKKWILAAEESRSYGEAMSAYREAMDIMPNWHIICYDHDLDTQLDWIRRDFAFFSCNAAGCALTLSDSLEAVIMLERWRAVFWFQVLQLRLTGEGLEPQLARQLNVATMQIQELQRQIPSKDVQGEELRRRQRMAHEEFQSLIQRARKDPGFPGFLLPIQREQLADVAKHGPVLILSSSESYGTHVLIIRNESSDIEHLSLTSISAQDLKSLVVSLDESVNYRREELRLVEGGEFDRLKVLKGDRRIKKGKDDILATLWTTVVQPIVYYLGLQVC